MKNKWIKGISFAAILVFLSACAAPSPTMDVAAMGTITALNVQLTQSAATLTSVIAQQSATPTVTNTPNATATLTPTVTITPTATVLDGLYLLFDADTNCRSGPGTTYGTVAKVGSGDRLKAIGRSEDGEFYYVRYFDTSNHYCWVWKGTSYQTGDPDWVPVMTTQPTVTPSITPTSDAGFTVSYNNLQSCNSVYFLNFTIKNVGYLTWQSVRIVIADNTTGKTVTNTANNFTGYSGCSVTETQGDLTTGEPGLVSSYSPGEFSYDPTGHSLGITVSLFSEKGNAGTMVTRSFSVTP